MQPELDDWDLDEGFKVNVSAQEASSEARTYQALPRGEYHVAITDVSLEQVRAGKNEGQPMFAFEMTVQGSKDKDDPDYNQYAGSKVFSRLMLWSGALYSIVQAMKAVGLPVNEGDLNIPRGEWWMGKELIAVVKQVPKKTKGMDGSYEDEFETVNVNGKEVRRKVMTNDVSGYRPLSALGTGSSVGAASGSSGPTLT